MGAHCFLQLLFLRFTLTPSTKTISYFLKIVNNINALKHNVIRRGTD